MKGLKIENLTVTYDKKCDRTFRNMLKRSPKTAKLKCSCNCQNNYECMLRGSLDDEKFFKKSKQKHVIGDFNVEINDGELVVILGNSGCGKSTLLSAISGLKEAEKGFISFGEKVFFDSCQKINLATEERNIGFCFQSYALWPHMTVEQNIAFPLKTRKMSRETIDKKVTWILQIVDMLGYEKRYPNELSGGEKQRIALARSLVYDPKLLLLDEPLANLDAKLKENLVKKIREIHDQLKLTTVYVTHDQNEAFEIADRIIIMRDGKIMQIGSPQDVYRNPENIFVSNFIGKNNILSMDDAKKLKLHVSKQSLGEPNVSIRPENITMFKFDDVKTEDSFSGLITHVSFHGDYVDYIVRILNIDLLVREYGKDLRQKGDLVKICLHEHP